MSDDCTCRDHEWHAFGASRYCQICGYVDAHPDARAAADEIERLLKLLEGRDKFIVDQGLWLAFVDQLDGGISSGDSTVHQPDRPGLNQ